MNKSEILNLIVKSPYTPKDVVTFCTTRGFYGTLRLKKGEVKTVKTRKDIQSLRFCYVLLEPITTTKSGKKSPKKIGELLSIQYQTVYAGLTQINKHLETEEGQKEFIDFCHQFESFLKSEPSSEGSIIHEESDTVISEI